MILAHLRYVVRVAKGYLGYGLPLGDLIQEGNIGLMKAVNALILKWAYAWSHLLCIGLKLKSMNIFYATGALSKLPPPKPT